MENQSPVFKIGEKEYLLLEVWLLPQLNSFNEKKAFLFDIGAIEYSYSNHENKKFPKYLIPVEQLETYRIKMKEISEKWTKIELEKKEKRALEFNFEAELAKFAEWEAKSNALLRKEQKKEYWEAIAFKLLGGIFVIAWITIIGAVIWSRFR